MKKCIVRSPFFSWRCVVKLIINHDGDVESLRRRRGYILTLSSCAGTATAVYGVPYTLYQALKDLKQECQNSISLSRDKSGMKILATVVYETVVCCSWPFSVMIQLPFDKEHLVYRILRH